MISESIRVRNCLHCGKDLLEQGKNRKAIFCNHSCKNRHRYLSGTTDYKSKRDKYKSEVRSRAILMYHQSRVGKRAEWHNELTPEWIAEKLTAGFCEVTGLAFVLTGEPRNPWSPSLDRIDSSVGYTLENTRVVVWIYNAAKNVFSDADVLLMAQAVVNRSDGSMK